VHNDGLALASTEVHILRSKCVGDDFKIHVGRCGFDDVHPDAAVPVLYVTDANGFFGAAVDMIRSMQLARHLPPMLVVGIGYRLGELGSTVDIRGRDLTPSYDKVYDRVYPGRLPTGGAPRFLDFLRDELMPWIAKRVPVDPSATTLFGHSLGGLFSTYVMLTEPDTFAKYVVSSPSYWWDKEMIFDYEAAYAGTHTDLRAKAFFGIGANEDADGRVREDTNMPEEARAITAAFPINMVATMQHFVETLSGRGYPSLNVTAQVFPDEFHITVAPLVLSRGLRWLFDAPS
jgi:predicted alpha/beta superfamily hydrolase